jgi:hypothetical protein
MTLYLTADFQAKESTMAAIQELKTTGFNPDDLAVFSDEPVEFPRGILDRPSHMSLAVVTGALTFCLLAIAFVYFTQYNYRLITGGMPVFSFWATGVVFYELTMFGAIFITFVWFLRESGLLRRSRRGPVPHVEPEVICLRVRCPSDRSDDVNRLLSNSGGANLRELGNNA